MSAPAAVPQFLGAWLCRRTELLRTVGASLTRAGLFLPLRVVHPGTSLHPPGGEPNGPLGTILSPRRIVGGRSPHPLNGGRGVLLCGRFVTGAVYAYSDLPGARHRTVPLGPCPLRQRGHAGREQQRHHVEPDVAGGDTARWVAVRDAEPRELVGPSPRSDGSAVELQRGDDEKDTGVRGACRRAP